jgi:serine/threonine-protein kinase
VSVASTRRVIAGYELDSKLAVGGMASVHLGRAVGQGGPREVVAIKRLHEHLAHDPAFANVLLQEARITQRIRHPNVVRTLDVVTGDDELLLVMEYVPGETVARLLRATAAQKQTCSVEIAASVIRDTLRGLEAAHQTKDESGELLEIVHRDVSPQNIIVGTSGVAKVLDFGIAKVIGSQVHTRTNELKGKIGYMAPEVLDFSFATPQADVWAAAVTLWEMLCGQRLFKGDSEASTWLQVTSGEIRTPGEVRGAPTPLDDIVMRGLSREPSKRYASAAQMADDIERAVVPAPAATVAAWVASLSSPSPIAVVAPAPLEPAPAAAPAPRTRPRARIVGALVAALALAVVITLAWRAPRAGSGSATTSASSEPPLAASSEPAREPPPEGSPAGEASASPPVTGPPTPRVQHNARPLVRAPSRARKPDSCDPPYVVDSAGRKMFKIECVK